MVCLENHPSGKKSLLDLGDMGLKLEVTQGYWLLGDILGVLLIEPSQNLDPAAMLS